MRCGACGTENREGRRFCGSCGAALVAVCPSCGTPADDGDRFCGVCGAALVADAPAAAGASERRMVSVLFADLVGFTALSETRDPEEVRELLGRYFDASRVIVARHGGAIEKFIGDAVMAVWGAPVAQEDDAERAVRTALELVAAVRALGEEVGHPLQARAAVATGDAAVTVGAAGQGMVAGDLVNTASRIQAAATPGTVLVDEATRRLTAAAIATEPIAPLELKGKRDRVPVWQATWVAAGVGGQGRTAGIEPPFVGRERELRLLKDLYHATAEGGRAHLVNVVGIAGIGKSRLAWEFEKYADGLSDTVLWHRGRCLSYGDGVAFWALAEMVRMRAGIVEDEPAAEASEKLAAAISEWMDDPGDREWVTPPLRHLLGLEPLPGGDRGRLFPAWRRFIEALTERDPVALVFEDLQWADEALLDFVEYLMEWSRGHRLFVLALARPDLAERRPGWGAGTRALTTLGLEPLTREAMTELVAGMVPGLPAPAVERIADAAEGVPLYAVETARMLIDRGDVTRAAGGFAATRALSELEIPETLHALVAARLDALPEDERRVLREASVLGKSFTLEGLTAVTGREAGEIEMRLGSLGRKEFLAVETDPRSPERGQYRFLQDIVRSIARDTLGRRERKQLHLACAAYLEGLEGAELAEVIAAHQLDAYRLVPDDADAPGVRDRARETLLRAADRARTLGAPDEALRIVTQALELTGDDEAAADLRELGGELAQAAGHLDTAERLLTEALALHAARGRDHAAARVRAHAANVLFLAGRAAEASEELEAAYAVLAPEPGDADLAHLAHQVGRMRAFTGDGARSLEPLDHAIDIAETLGLPGVLSHALNTKALWVLARTGHREEARSLMLGALRVAEDHDEWDAVMRAYFNISFEREQVDDLSHDYDVDGLALARRLGDRQWERSFVAHICYAHLRRGAWDDACALAEESLASPGAESDAFAQGLYCHPLAIVHAHRGRFEEARRCLDTSAQVASGDNQSAAGQAAGEATLLAEQGRHAEAVAAGGAALAHAADLGLDHPMVREGLIEMSLAALGAGDEGIVRDAVARLDALPPARLAPRLAAHRAVLRAGLSSGEQAERHFEEAVAGWRRLGDPWYLAGALTHSAAYLARAGRDPAAPLGEAREIYERLGARPALERLASIDPAPAVSA